MKHLALIALVLLPLACATQSAKTRTTSVPGHGAISLTITPNPVVAIPVSGTIYDLPFDVVVKETGGRPITISRVMANVYAGGGIQVASESYDAARIQSLGFATSIPAKGELRYHFAPRKDVHDDRLFNGFYGDVRVEASDDAGTPTSASTTVTLKR